MIKELTEDLTIGQVSMGAGSIVKNLTGNANLGTLAGITAGKSSGKALNAIDDAATGVKRIKQIDNTASGIKSVDSLTQSGVGGVNKSRIPTSRPTWRQSELDAAKKFSDYDAQKSFINGEKVPYGTKGSVRPDYFKGGYSVDIKNYNVESTSGRSNLARNIEKQYYQRIENLPGGTKQSVMIDIRGQNVSDADLSALYDDIMQWYRNTI